AAAALWRAPAAPALAVVPLRRRALAAGGWRAELLGGRRPGRLEGRRARPRRR
ncbi:unnamed protein product, partial [Prorocentrum cordatum]